MDWDSDLWHLGLPQVGQDDSVLACQARLIRLLVLLHSYNIVYLLLSAVLYQYAFIRLPELMRVHVRLTSLLRQPRPPENTALSNLTPGSFFDANFIGVGAPLIKARRVLIWPGQHLTTPPMQTNLDYKASPPLSSSSNGQDFVLPRLSCGRICSLKWWFNWQLLGAINSSGEKSNN